MESPERRVLLSESWSFTLFDEGGALVLEVVCGSVGLYEVRVVLSEEERLAFEREGAPAIQRIVRRVQLAGRA